VRFRGWPKVRIKNDCGEIVDAIAPLIISASRSTDIPALYAEWFFKRLHKGYMRWVNPFNQRTQYVSFENVRLIVFWSKNPAPIIPFLDILYKKRINYLFQYTLNDYESEALEPNLPSLQARIKTFIELSQRSGIERLLWRFDPLILTDTISPETLVKRVETIGEQVAGHVSRLTISFMTHYAKVMRNMAACGFLPRQFDSEAIAVVAAGLQNLSRRWGIPVFSCAEPQSLDAYGIKHGACIDPYYIADIFRDDPVLRGFCSCGEEASQLDLLAQDPRDTAMHPYRDPGQREHCRCIVSKDIGTYDTCTHFCAYCYANSSRNNVILNRKRITGSGDLLVDKPCL